MRLLGIASTALLLIGSALGDYTPEAQADKVEWSSLPGASNLNVTFNQFAGYVTIDANSGKQYFYWFFEAQNNPENAPVVLWTNGGPGCSGFLGLFTEQGPIRPDVNGNLYLNPYSWNQLANIIFIEQPTGVGFSKSKTSSDYTMGDDQAAKDNYVFIQNWLKKFPQYRANDFHITSESYGGHYMPTLARELVTKNPPAGSADHINFKGFAVGNPYTDAFSNNLGQFEKYYGEQILPKPLWTSYLTSCGTPDLRTKNDQVCSNTENQFNSIIGDLDPYALDFPVCTSAQGGWLMKMIGSKLQYEPCEQDYVSTYLNNAEVKKAIHADTSISWAGCSAYTNYNQSDLNVPMMPIYKELVGNHGLNILVYSGDDDSVCSTSSTQYWIWDLGYQVKNYWQVWEVSKQVAGYYSTFEKNFAFVTVHSAGHEVPTFQPERALTLFKNYLSGYWFNPTTATQ